MTQSAGPATVRAVALSPEDEFLSQIELAPDECLARNMLTRWYGGKRCVFCRRVFTQIHWPDRQPALLTPARTTVEWSEIPAERLPSVLATHRPVCWSCHIAETFRRQHPELVVDRPERHRSA